MHQLDNNVVNFRGLLQFSYTLFCCFIIFNIKQKLSVARSLSDDIKTKQLQLYGHVQRMGDWRLPKAVMKWSPPGRRKPGRPKLTWAEGI